MHTPWNPHLLTKLYIWIRTSIIVNVEYTLNGTYKNISVILSDLVVTTLAIFKRLYNFNMYAKS